MLIIVNILYIKNTKIYIWSLWKPHQKIIKVENVKVTFTHHNPGSSCTPRARPSFTHRVGLHTVAAFKKEGWLFILLQSPAHTRTQLARCIGILMGKCLKARFRSPPHWYSSKDDFLNQMSWPVPNNTLAELCDFFFFYGRGIVRPSTMKRKGTCSTALFCFSSLCFISSHQLC